MESYGTEGFWLNERVVVSMPHEPDEWTMTLGESLAFASLIRDTLFLEAVLEGREVMDLLEELGELKETGD